MTVLAAASRSWSVSVFHEYAQCVLLLMARSANENREPQVGCKLQEVSASPASSGTDVHLPSPYRNASSLGWTRQTLKEARRSR